MDKYNTIKKLPLNLTREIMMMGDVFEKRWVMDDGEKKNTEAAAIIEPSCVCL